MTPIYLAVFVTGNPAFCRGSAGIGPDGNYILDSHNKPRS